jgi:hypothetical protein
MKSSYLAIFVGIYLCMQLFLKKFNHGIHEYTLKTTKSYSVVIFVGIYLCMQSFIHAVYSFYAFALAFYSTKFLLSST